jgi:hypothetical protein
MILMSKNQCMGCQAGWPTKEMPRFGAVTPPHTYTLHLVQGGYPYEVVRCTADRYTTCGSLIQSVSGDPCENPAEPGELCFYCAEFKAMCDVADAPCNECDHPMSEHGMLDYNSGTIVCDHGAYEVRGLIAPCLHYPCDCGIK